MQAVIGTESGESHQVELGDEQLRALTGLKIGDEVDGSVLGLRGYTLRITGGSDNEGFPMRASVEGTGRKKLLLEGGTGAQDLEKGERKRKSVRGNTVSGQLSQVNLEVVDEGDEDIETLLGEEPEEDAGDEEQEEPEEESGEESEESEEAEDEGGSGEGKEVEEEESGDEEVEDEEEEDGGEEPEEAEEETPEDEEEEQS